MGMQSPPTRRQILHRLTGGGAVLWTCLAGPAARMALAGIRAAPPLILLDPGHGGHDPGAIGATGTLEKDVTLAGARAVKAALEAGGRYRVVLTRATDRFIALGQRVDMARDQGADLFLSLHADSDPAATVRGAAVYTLANRASDTETEALANRENGVDAGAAPDGVDPGVSRILASLANREVRAKSARIAHQLVRDFERDLPVLPSPERRANFTVLQTAGIPSVLIEMGFLSNPGDEAALNDPDHQALIASAVNRTVDIWFAQGGGADRG